jgi:hypothetical protein
MNHLFWKNHLDSSTVAESAAAPVPSVAGGSRLAARGAGIMGGSTTTTTTTTGGGGVRGSAPNINDIDMKYRVAGARSGHAGSAIPDAETGLVMANEGNNTNAMWSLLVDPSAAAPAPVRRMVS